MARSFIAILALSAGTNSSLITTKGLFTCSILRMVNVKCKMENVKWKLTAENERSRGCARNLTLTGKSEEQKVTQEISRESFVIALLAVESISKALCVSDCFSCSLLRL